MSYTVENIPFPPVLNRAIEQKRFLQEKIVYLVSDALDYRLLICADAGPQFAHNFGWRYDTLRNAINYLNQGITILFDTRMSEDEYAVAYQMIAQNPASEFIATVTDPYYEECIDKPLYRFLFKTTTLPNVRYLTQYQPTEIIAFLRNIKGMDSMLVLNYPYLKEKEVNKPLPTRKHKIIFSGSLSKGLYPERFLFRYKYRRSLFRLLIDDLVHPGYPNSNESFSHNKVGQSYIDHLSRYKFMYIGASRCNLEFMKYSECAYAGCIPVGHVPGTFNDELRKFVQPVDNRRLHKSLVKIFSMPQKEQHEIAAGYRKAFAAQRDPVLLNEKFITFLQAK